MLKKRILLHTTVKLTITYSTVTDGRSCSPHGPLVPSVQFSAETALVYAKSYNKSYEMVVLICSSTCLCANISG